MAYSDKEKKRYQKQVTERMPKSNAFVQCISAFLVGGLICCIGQAIMTLGTEFFKFSKENTAAFTSMSMIFLGSFLTGLGVYDKIGKVAGAGSIIPITGFANSIVAPAMEHRFEGYILGVGAQMFTVAGPVLVYGVISSIIVGIIYCFI
ncbi:MAG: stage V sporulation protein AC [Clostridia bacterium]|nr:stage V sporulation protein AC [Clostridia bacterium]